MYSTVAISGYACPRDSPNTRFIRYLAIIEAIRHLHGKSKAQGFAAM